MVISMMWQCRVTLIDVRNCQEVCIRHKKPLKDADIILIYDGKQHYNAICKYMKFFTVLYSVQLIYA